MTEDGVIKLGNTGILGAHEIVDHYYPSLRTAEDGNLELRGYLYIIQLDQGWVKVGTTSEPGKRIAGQTRSYRNKHGLTLLRVWYSTPTLEPRQVEDHLKLWARTHSDALELPRPRKGSSGESETFHGIEFNDAVAFARTLDYAPIDDRIAFEAVRLKRRKRNYEKRVWPTLSKHIKTHRTFEGFELPVFPNYEDTKGLTDLDLATREGLIEFVRASRVRTDIVAQYLPESLW